MTEELENVPPIMDMPPEEMDEIKRKLGLIASGSSTGSSEQNQSTPIQRRGRGRPRKYKYDETGKPTNIPLESDEQPEEPLGTLPAPKLSTRDSKEIANRLKGILIGSTGIGAVLNPHVQMTEKEAENIATPLTAYLVRTEATSVMARRVLNEYDLTAFVIATLAYMVRVVKDIRSEREAAATSSPQAQSSGRRILQRVGTSIRNAEPEVESPPAQTNGENAEGSEGIVDRQRASSFAEFRRVTEV